MPRFLPLRANLEWLKKTAKDRLKVLRGSSPEAKLHQAQLELAREFGFSSWRAMVHHVTTVRDQLRESFPGMNWESTSNEQIKPDDPDLVRFLDAVRDGETEQVVSALSTRPALAKAYGSNGMTALHVAAQFNDERLAIVLLAHDADPHAVIKGSGHTVLSWAATCNAMDFARSLVRLAVRPDLFSAAGVGSLDNVKAFFDDQDQLMPNASQTGSSRRSESGSPLPCPPTTSGEQLADALYIACRNGHTDVVEFLLTKNPDLSFKAFLGATPLHWASFSGSRATIEKLLATGADPTTVDDTLFCTPRLFGICVTASWGFLFKVQQLLRDDPTLLRESDGQTSALHEAAAAGQTAVVRFLLESGANPQSLDRLRRTPLQRASDNGHQEVVDLLQSRLNS